MKTSALKWVALMVVLIAVLAGGAWYAYSRGDARVEEPAAQTDNYEPQRGSLSGVTICLPHKAGYPQTEECAFGMKADNGKNYILDFSVFEATKPEFSIGTRISANGVIVPIERLSTDHWQSYDVVGVFSVTDGLQIESPK